jgi:NAD(P)-dependent dehydrogenase (short-subunit alcohol dehydrogenase family)
MSRQDRNKAETPDEMLEVQRDIQAEIDNKTTKASDTEKPEAMQAGQRQYPTEFEAQHLAKPGHEAELAPAPMYDAPGYVGSQKLADKAALITGGDSGIGRAVAVLYAREGADVAIVYLCEHEDAKATKAAVEKEGRRCILVPGDVSDPAFCRSAVEKTAEAFGKLDILVNNAAFQEHASDILDISDVHFDTTLKTNLYGYFYMARAAVPHLQPGSAIIMTGSVTGIQGSESLLDYSMTKGGIHAFARSLSASLIPRGIRVNVVAPGPVWTPLNPADQPAEKVKSFGSKTPMGRAAQPEEIAPAYVFLAAPACSSYITGEILPIVGGYK